MTHRYDLFDEEIAKLVSVGIISVVAILLMAGSHRPVDCQRIADSSARLACYDAASSPQPAKGAAVPPPLMETSMTLSIHWDDARPGAKAATRTNARKAALRVINALAVAVGVAAVLAAIVAIRIYAFVPGLGA